ncbi:DeoR/GlpR family DNA-binding transcription regulator [Priestia filamentosa]|uniref:DNA-binding protein n=1 Tax=Priestia filamentosa TaxID=1402861 RepID=A0A1X7E2U5_9BACI|nr:DeoR/GlpR family DNA-binding transcription regulator [Priestia filamentosa]AKO92324.1 DNA-binding protein [Priestia filamentosa]MDT3762363.1 DeoR/GlpR family DNA-binding transcription regulator [Priestia filamentosa]OXS68927.1 DNA-binding protein [Priestia filamentosa]RJS64369.1 DeoR/GlpR transcriptional regulator [Priestia filamentosa]WCM17437.1 DeoR/GlpR family DNA-binding transcription regulator [Priestia filamentosa]
MLKAKRIQQIQDYVLEHQSVSLDELVTVFDVSKNTIRRDVQMLVDQGVVKKVYGGVAVDHAQLESFNDRKTRNQLAKQAIAKEAANYVEDGDVIFIDSGTTTLEMLEFVKNKNITVITNNLDFIVYALPYENLKVISTGGALERETKSFSSFKNMDLLKTYNVNKAFMASTGVSISNGVTNSSPVESEIKQAVVRRSVEVFLLIDHTKFDKYALITYCELEELDYLITDASPNESYGNYAQRNNINIVIAQND